MRYLNNCPSCGTALTVQVNLSIEPNAPRKGPKRFEYDPEIIAFVIEAIETYRSSFSTVAELLEKKGVLTPKGHKRWFPASVKRMYDDAVERRMAD